MADYKKWVSRSRISVWRTIGFFIKRENISVEELVDVARRGSKIDANTYAEIILNLPGDTVAAHTQSLRDAVNSGVSYLRMYQLILLPHREMNTQETRNRFGIQTAWRIMPRCFGHYEFQGERFAGRRGRRNRHLARQHVLRAVHRVPRTRAHHRNLPQHCSIPAPSRTL